MDRTWHNGSLHSRRFVGYFFLINALLLSGGCARKDDHAEIVRTKYYHTYGPELPERVWEEEGRTGRIVNRHKNGVETVKTYLSGMLDGRSTWSYPNSPIVQRYEDYSQGILIAQGTNYETGISETRRELGPGQRRMIREWYEDGSPRCVEEFSAPNTLITALFFTEDGIVDQKVENGNGIRIERTKGGLVEAKEHYTSGLCTLREEFYPNGAPKYTYSLKNGQKDGTARAYGRYGEPLTSEEWKNGQLDGMWISFKNGSEESQIPYKNGLKDGTELHFTPGTGTIVAKISWVDGRKHGSSLFIFPDQEVVDWYWKDKKVSKEEFERRKRRADEVEHPS